MIKVWWHCLWRMLSRDDHRMCKFTLGDDTREETFYCCLCGYGYPERWK